MGRAKGINDIQLPFTEHPCFILASRHHVSCRSLLNSSFTPSDLFFPSHSWVCPSVSGVEDNSIGSVVRSRKESLWEPICPTSLLHPSHGSQDAGNSLALEDSDPLCSWTFQLHLGQHIELTAGESHAFSCEFDMLDLGSLWAPFPWIFG